MVGSNQISLQLNLLQETYRKRQENVFTDIAKGQIISEKIIVRISALAFKMGQIKKIKTLYYIKWYIITNLHDNVPLSF